MIIALTTSGDDLTAILDKRFGRAPKFLIYNTETKEFTIKDNGQNLNAAQGAGIQAGQNVAATGADAVITGHCGPKAFVVLNAAKIAIYNCKADTIQQAIDMFNNNELTPSVQADVEGHWL